MREHTAWRIQAQADLRAAERLVGQLGDQRAFCHAAAKYQQAVEKSIKALQSALFHAGLFCSKVGSDHKVAKVASGIRSAAPTWPKTKRGYKQQIEQLLSDDIITKLKHLDEIVPKYPEPGQLPKRNTEYPFQLAAGPSTWRAPCEEDVFSKSEIRRFRACATKVQRMTGKIVTALELAYP